MDKIPAYASINTAAEQTKIRVGFRLTGMVNGVLRNIVRNRENITYPSREKEPVAYLAVYYSHPEWIVEQWINAYGLDQTINILEYNNEPARINLRCNQLKASRSQLIEKLAEDGIKAVPAEYPWAAEVESTESPIIDSSAFKQGWFYIQGSASMLAAPILKPLPGQIVYDLCCGVGGKTTHLAENMENRGVIKAIDLYEHKINLLRENSGRLGIKIIDASVRDLRTVDTVNWDRAPRVLLDAPCSGLGVFNRRADARWHKKVEEIKELTLLQKELLDKAANLVERNGLLLYSTCTINRAENEEIISDFLMRHRDFGLQGFAQDIGFLPLTAAEVQQATQGMFTLLPGNHRTDGMFYALMRRN
jgi:16S rRNA (cytosine967-C5)-methyltransferase